MCSGTLSAMTSTNKNNMFLYVNKYMCNFSNDVKKICVKNCANERDMITCKVVLKDLQSSEMDPKEFARSLQKRKVTSKMISEGKKKLVGSTCI